MDYYDHHQKRGSSTMAFIIGAMAGGLTALLFAPHSGAETRHRLRRRASDLKEHGQRWARRAEDHAESAAHTFRDAVNEAKYGYQAEMDRQRENRPGYSNTHDTSDTSPRSGV